jgi:hypothetical protein
MICFSETNLTKDKVRFPIIVSLNVKLTQFSDCESIEKDFGPSIFCFRSSKIDFYNLFFSFLFYLHLLEVKFGK